MTKIKMLNYKSEIFSNQETAIEILISEGVISAEIPCRICNSCAKIQIKLNAGFERIFYRCNVKKCQARSSLLNTKISLDKYLFLFYLHMLNLNYQNIRNLSSCSESTIKRMKIKFRKSISTYTKNRKFYLGGPGITVEIDETVICRRGIIRNPSAADDMIKDTIWIVGAVELSNERRCLLFRVENRQSTTLSKTFEGLIAPGSILHSDGYPSYPEMARNLNLIHKIVDHSKGFKSSDGIHTNNIEGLWSGLKQAMRQEHGVKRNNIDIWLEEYAFRYNYLRDIDDFRFKDIYFELLKIHLNQ